MKHIKESSLSQGGKKMAISVYTETELSIGVFPEAQAEAIYKELIDCAYDIYGVCGCSCRSGSEENWFAREVYRACQSAQPGYTQAENRIKELKIIEVPEGSEFIGATYGGANIAVSEEINSLAEEGFDPDLIFNIEEQAKHFRKGDFITFRGWDNATVPEGRNSVKEKLWRYTNSIY